MKMKPFVFLNNIKKSASVNLYLDNITENVKLRHVPSVSKEWKDNVYSFNLFKTQNFPVFGYLIDNLISAYFSSCFHIGKYKVKLLRTKKKLKKKTEIYQNKQRIYQNFY